MNKIILVFAFMLFHSHLKSEELLLMPSEEEIAWGSHEVPAFERYRKKSSKSKSKEEHLKNSSIEVRGAAFFHTSRLFREIYGTVNGSYQIEMSTRLYNHLDGWVNFDWSSRHGKSIGFKDPTKVRIANSSFGVKYLFPFYDRFTAYIGGGPSLSVIWIKNESFCPPKCVSKLAVGGLLKTGVYYDINDSLFLDLFADYLYQPVRFQHLVDIGGVKVGFGLGGRF